MTDATTYLKMNGLGNDFVVVDARTQKFAVTSDQVRAIANRDTGIGCDQLIVMEAPNMDGPDVFMRIFNAEGGQVDACGNASRCVAGYLAEQLGKDTIEIETNAGLLIGKIEGDQVSVDYGPPKFDWQLIPLSEEFGDTRGIELQIGPIDAPLLHTPSVVNVGNPHAVFWINDDPDNYDLHLFGPLLENHPIFPQRANIELAQVLGPDRIKVRVWERGVGLTQACGTGAMAVAVCAMRKNLVERNVIIDLPGGPLEVEWRESDHHIIMSGPWSVDGTGELPASLMVEPAA